MRNRYLAATFAAMLLLTACGDDDDADVGDDAQDQLSPDDGTEGVGDDEAPAIVTFLSPSDGDTVSNPVVITPNVVGATIAPAADSGTGEGHYHVMIDAECVATGETIPSDESHVHFGDGSTSLTLPELEPGEHTLCLQLGDSAHTAFGATSTISVTVE